MYRDFTRVGSDKMPDAKTMGRWGVALGPDTIKDIHARIVQIAQDKGVVQGRRMRVDTTVVEANIHFPTDSSLLGDGVRVLTRAMRKITELTGQVGTKLRDSTRSVGWRLREIGRTARSKAPASQDKMKRAYGKLLETTARVVGQAKRFSKEIGAGVKRCLEPVQQVILEGHGRFIDEMLPRVQQVIRQTKARIFDGESRSEGKIVSLFEPSTEIIRKGKASKPTEFGKLVKLQEAENQIVTGYDVYPQRPQDKDLLIPAIEEHQAKLGRPPHLVAADAGFYSAKNEAEAKAKGVRRVSIPKPGSRSAARNREQKKRWFRDGQRWRTGCEGRISVGKRRHGLNRCRYRGEDGMKRWVGFGVIADNLINVGVAIDEQSTT